MSDFTPPRADQHVRLGVWFPVTVILVFLLFVSWVLSEHRRSSQWRIDWVEQRTQDISMGLFGMINAQLFDGTYITKRRLTTMLEGLVRSNRAIRAIELYGIDGSVLASASSSELGDRSTDIVRPLVVPTTPFEMGRSPGGTTGLVRPIVVDHLPTPDERKGLPRLAELAMHLVVFSFDGTFMKSAGSRAIMRTGVAIVLAALVAGTMLLLWRNLQRSADLAIRLVQAREKNLHLEEMRLAAAGLAHETRNPLNVVRTIAQSLNACLADPDLLRQRTGTIIEEVDHINARLAEFIDYSRPREPAFASLDVRKLAGEIAALLQPDAEDEDVVLTVEGEIAPVLADGAQIRQVIFNLALNAVNASTDGGTITVRVGLDGDEKGWLEVEDEGPGVPADIREDIFLPYFTRNEQGTGLGLAVVRQIVAAHGWTIRYVDRPGCGAVFRIEGMQPA